MKSEIEKLLKLRITNIEPASGGCIGSSFKITANNNIFFAKIYNKAEISTAEALGLLEIESKKVIKTPKVINYDKNILILEYIKEGKKSSIFNKRLGEQLATLHKQSNRYFGLNNDNFIGSTKQLNNKEKNWINFYIKHRLDYQVFLATKNGFNLEHKYNKLRYMIPDILSDSTERPSLVHGDLWCGNVIADINENPVLIDPAAYYGHREAELAMTKLFGGFTKEFYNSYNIVYPLKKRWQDRENIYKLYHILNHLNLFGSSYLSQAISLMDYYVR